MQIDDKTIANLEQLSALKLSDTAKAQLQTDLNQIIDFMAVLQEVDTSSLDDSVNASERLRADQTRQNIDTSVIDDILAQAPKVQDKQFIVPKIIQ